MYIVYGTYSLSAHIWYRMSHCWIFHNYSYIVSIDNFTLNHKSSCSLHQFQRKLYSVLTSMCDILLQTMMEKDLVDLYRKCEESPLKVSPAKGKAVIWYNHFVDDANGWLGPLDEFTFHGGCPVKNGVKWIANFWVKTTDHKIKDLKKMQKFYKASTEKQPKMSKEEL